MSGEHACTYYTCWYNQETKLLLTAEGGQLPPCNVLVNELAKIVSLEIETSGDLNLTTGIIVFFVSVTLNFTDRNGWLICSL